MLQKKQPLTPSIEDYLETIYVLDKDKIGVRSIDVAMTLDVSKPSVNKALRNLVSAGLAEQEKYSLIHLTDIGREKAKEIITRHETIKEFLLNVLQVPENIAENEACMIEHSMSNETVTKMREFLNVCTKNIKKK